MARAQSRYVCQSCGEAFLRWEGQCRNCGGWNSLVETLVREPAKGARVAATSRQRVRPGDQPEALARVADLDLPRLSVGLPELDRVLGGGLVPGSVVLVGGEPGIGKSTLLLQAAAGVAELGTVLYASGEESAAQVRLRATRLGLTDGLAGQAVRVVAEIVDRSDRRPGARRAAQPADRRLDPDGHGRRARRCCRQRRPGSRVGAPADGAGQRQQGRQRGRRQRLDRGGDRRPRHEGRLAGRSEDPRAPRRCGDQPRRRALRQPAPAALDQEPVRLDRGGRRPRDGRARPLGAERPGPGVPRRARWTGRRAASSPRPSRAPGR